MLHGKYPVYSNSFINDGLVGYYDDNYRIKAPAVTVTGRGNVGHSIARTTNFTPVVRLLSVKSKHNVNFLENVINNHKIIVESTGVPQLTSPQLGNYKICFPSINEENKIGNLIKQLNNIIELQMYRLTLYEGIRMGIFKKLFPTEVNKSPKINFSHADKSWKKQLLLSYINRIIDFRGKTPKKLGMNWAKDGILALSALNVKQGYIDKKVDAHFGNESLYDKWMAGKELYKGQVLMTTEAPMGNVAQVPDDDKYILSQRTIAFDVNDKKITNDFLAVILKSSKTFNDLSALSSGGTAKGISQRSLSELKITVPKSIEYQKYISEILNEIDKLIDLQKDEINKIKNLKKYCLQKLFI